MQHIGLSRQEIQRIEAVISDLDAATPSAESDRRLRPRVDYSHGMWLCLPDAPEHPWIHIFSRNLSTGGLAFLARKEFLPGEHIVVSHTLGERVPHLVLGCVKFCRIVYVGICEVGIEFVSARSDPTNSREIPPEWIATAQRTAWVARQMQAPF